MQLSELEIAKDWAYPMTIIYIKNLLISSLAKKHDDMPTLVPIGYYHTHWHLMCHISPFICKVGSI
jgi:hypothetical protein